MFIDDNLPVIEDINLKKLIPVFSSNKQDLLWVSFIEKAYAKIHLTYNNTQGSSPIIA